MSHTDKKIHLPMDRPTQGLPFATAWCDFRMVPAAQLAKRAFVKVFFAFALAYSLTLSISSDSDDP